MVSIRRYDLSTSHLLHSDFFKSCHVKKRTAETGVRVPDESDHFFCDDPINEFAIRHFVIAFAFFCIAEIPAFPARCRSEMPRCYDSSF